jgi:hypothetical protein
VRSGNTAVPQDGPNMGHLRHRRCGCAHHNGMHPVLKSWALFCMALLPGFLWIKIDRRLIPQFNGFRDRVWLGGNS